MSEEYNFKAKVTLNCNKGVKEYTLKHIYILDCREKSQHPSIYKAFRIAYDPIGNPYWIEVSIPAKSDVSDITTSLLNAIPDVGAKNAFTLFLKDETEFLNALNPVELLNVLSEKLDEMV